MITGINHLTLAVKSLERSMRFYTAVLGLRPVASWATGAYLQVGACWVALSEDPFTRDAALPEETHFAFSISSHQFPEMVERLLAANVPVWRKNQSEGPSLYILDPDGHKLEIHVGSLETRLAHLAQHSPDHVTIEAGLDSVVPDLSTRHQQFPAQSHIAEDLSPDPLVQFRVWLEAADAAGETDPYAMSLSTIGEAGAPSSRTVALKGCDSDGLIFTAPFVGPKAEELARDPRASVVFYWPRVGRQVRAQGTVARLSADESASYFYSRPRESQLALLVASPGVEVSGREVLEERFAKLEKQYRGREIPRPEWGAFKLNPEVFEFWQGRSDRLHDRFRYVCRESGDWTRVRLTPWGLAVGMDAVAASGQGSVALRLIRRRQPGPAGGHAHTLRQLAVGDDAAYDRADHGGHQMPVNNLKSPAPKRS